MGARKTSKESSLDGKSLVRAAVLSVLIEKPGHGWDVARRASRRMGSAWRIEAKHIYSYLERLQKEGLIRSEKAASGHNPDRTLDVYYPTEKGEEARRAWITTPLEYRAVTTDLDVRLLFSTEEDIPDLLGRLSERRERVIEEIEANALTETPSVSYRARAINMHRSSVESRLRAELEWLEKTQRELELERDRLGR